MRTRYISGFAAKSALRRSKKTRSLRLVFAAAAAATVIASGAAAGASHNALDNFMNRTGGNAYVRGLEKARSGAIRETTVPAELGAALACFPDSGIVQRTDFRARLVAKGRTAYAMVRGLDFRRKGSMAGGFQSLSGDPATALERRGDGSGIVLARKAAEALEVSAGDGLFLQASDHLGRITVESLFVAAVVEDDALLEDGSAWMDLAEANRIRGYRDGECGYVAVRLADPRNEGPLLYKRLTASLKETKAALPLSPGQGSHSTAWDDFSSQTKGQSWDGRRYLFVTTEDCLVYPLRVIEAAGAAADFLIVLILALASIGATSSFSMIVRDRTRELGTLSALGATASDLFRLSVAESVFVALAGALAGCLAGEAALGALALIRLPQIGFFSVFLQRGFLRPRPDLLSPLLACAACAVSAAIGSIAPARRAARLDPAKAFAEFI
jgi:putative ABC transport system permease protein